MIASDVTPTEAPAGKDPLKDIHLPAKESATGDGESLKQRTESEEDTTGVAKEAEGTGAPVLLDKDKDLEPGSDYIDDEGYFSSSLFLVYFKTTSLLNCFFFIGL